MPFAEFMTENGFMVVAHDHLGHGESVSSKKDWGYMAEGHPSDILVKDMHTLRTTIKRKIRENHIYVRDTAWAPICCENILQNTEKV